MKVEKITSRLPPYLRAGYLGDEVRETASEARDEVAAKMTPDQIAEAQRMARE